MEEKEFLKRVEKLKEFSKNVSEMYSKGNKVSHSQPVGLLYPLFHGNKEEKKNAKKELIEHFENEIEQKIITEQLSQYRKHIPKTFEELVEKNRKEEIRVQRKNEKLYEEKRQKYLKENPQVRTKQFIILLFSLIGILLLISILTK